VTFHPSKVRIVKKLHLGLAAVALAAGFAGGAEAATIHNTASGSVTVLPTNGGAGQVFGNLLLGDPGRANYLVFDLSSFANQQIGSATLTITAPGFYSSSDASENFSLWDYSGNVGTLYNVPSSSSVVNQVEYIPTPGATGSAVNWSNPDGIGIPTQAKYPKAAAKFIQWFTSEHQQVDFAGVNGPSKAWPTYPLPSHLSAVKVMATKGKLVGGDTLSAMLATSKPVFAGGAPPWYPQFSNSVYTNLHAAAAGSETVAQAIKAIATTANGLAG